MILNVEPGGWGADTARPARPSTAPSDGRMTATPPRRLPRAFAAACWSPRWIVVCSERPALRGSLTMVRWPNFSDRLRGAPLAGAQAGEPQRRGPGDPAVAVLVVRVEDQRALQRPEVVGRHLHRDAHGTL